MQASEVPVKAVLLDLGATTDLDVPSADTLGEFAEDLHSQNVRLMLTRVITPVRQMLEKAGAMDKINPKDIYFGPGEAVLNIFCPNAMMPEFWSCSAMERIRSAVCCRQAWRLHLPNGKALSWLSWTNSKLKSGKMIDPQAKPRSWFPGQWPVHW